MRLRVLLMTMIFILVACGGAEETLHFSSDATLDRSNITPTSRDDEGLC